MFVTFYFPLFLGMTVLCFFSLKKGWRPYVLWVASCLLCAAISVGTLFILMGITVMVFFFATKIETDVDEGNCKRAKELLLISIGACIVLLLTYKYVPKLQQAMPIGLSFYVFQAIGYLVDVYRKKCKAEKKFVYLAIYFSFFAKLVSGPIERGNQFIPQLKKMEEVLFFHRGRLSTAFSYILWGYFMKMVVADRLAVTVDRIFAEPQIYDSLWLLIGAFLYTIQIYCDFAGYSYIAIGCARIFGLKLTQNFNAPYCAGNIIDFWNNWHISLSSWLRDYLYIPLGGNRKGTLRKYRNLMIVFLACGVWHGAGLHYIVWGMLHGVYSVINHVWRTHCRNEKSRLYCALSWGVTFLTVMVTWIIFRARDLETAFLYIRRMITVGFITDDFRGTISQLGLSSMEIIIIILLIMIVALVDFACHWKQTNLPEWIQYKNNAVRYTIFYLLIITIFVFGIYGPGYQSEQFIYMQF